MVSDLSSNGDVVVGISSDGVNDIAFRWEGGTMSSLGTLGGNYSAALATSADGSIVVGEASDNTHTHAFRWQSGTMTDLGTLGGTFSGATNISSDGSTIVGVSGITGDAETHAFRWKNGTMTDLGTLGGTESRATLVSANGNVVAGLSYTAGDAAFGSFRWEGGTMTNLGSFGGSQTYLLGMSTDGSTLVGQSAITGDTATHAFVWKNGTLTDVGSFGGQISALAGVSANGLVAVGAASDPGNTRLILTRWTEETGLEAIEDILAAHSVSTTGWDLSFAVDPYGFAPKVSDDGRIIVGTTTYNGEFSAFIFSYDAGTVVLVTPGELAQSLGTTTVVTSQQTQSSVSAGTSQSLFATQQAMSSFFSPSWGGSGTSGVKTSSAPASGVAAGSPAAPQKAAFAIGALGLGQNNDFGNYSGSGTTGMFFRATPETAVGAGLTLSGSHTDLPFGGRSRMSSYGGSLNVAHEAASGLRLYGTAGVSALDLSMRRHYRNGGGIDSSRGNTDGVGYGLAGRAGYSLPLASGDTIMPYLDLSYAHTVLDGYAETGGGAPASYGRQTSDIVISRLGGELTHQVNTQLQLRGRAAWGHEVSARGSTLTATSLTVTTAIPYASGSDRDWLEGGVTGIWQLDGGTSLTADAQLKAGKTGEPAVAAMMGITVGF